MKPQSSQRKIKEELRKAKKYESNPTHRKRKSKEQTGFFG